MLTHLERLGAAGEQWARRSTPWTNVYGMARSLLAAATALTLLFSGTATLFPVKAGAAGIAQCEGLRGAGLFCAVPTPSLGAVKWLCAVALLIVASGYRPRITAPIHFFISWSLHVNGDNLDGGDAVTAILTLFLLPVALTDPRPWHWSPPPAPRCTGDDDARRLVALFALTVIRIQVAVIYLDACIAKCAVEEWTDGTALYYWVNNTQIGASGLVRTLMHPILFSKAVALLTWSVLVAEYFLSAALVMPRRLWPVMWWIGLTLHVGIAFIHGILTFSIAMIAALTLYLKPIERPLALERVWDPLARLGRRILRAPLLSPHPVERRAQP